MNAHELSSLPPTAYLTPETFRTSFDALNAQRGYDAEQYAKGIKIGGLATAVYVTIRGSWAATMKDGSSMTSYETIGHHANTADLLRGFLDSGVAIYVWRWDATEAVKIK